MSECNDDRSRFGRERKQTFSAEKTQPSVARTIRTLDTSGKTCTGEMSNKQGGNPGSGKARDLIQGS